MEGEDRYSYRCWKDSRIIPDNLREGYRGFVIDMRLRHLLERPYVDDPLVLGSHGELVEYSTVHYPTVDNLVDKLDVIVLCSLDCCMNVNIPARIKKEISAQVLSLGKSMWNCTGNEFPEKVMPIAVEVVVRNLQEPNESEQEAIARAFSECADDIMKEIYPGAFASDDVSLEAFERMTARKSDIKALEYVRLEDLSSAKSCLICASKFSVGTVVGRMPCSHVSHANCIIGQLAVNNKFCFDCPLSKAI